MVPKKAPLAAAKSKQAAAGSSSSGQLEPSRYLNLENLDKVKLLLADDTNEWGATAVYTGSKRIEQRTDSVH